MCFLIVPNLCQIVFPEADIIKSTELYVRLPLRGAYAKII